MEYNKSCTGVCDDCTCDMLDKMLEEPPFGAQDVNSRKSFPVYSGLLTYFPDAIMEVANCSLVGNRQHHKDKPLHWDKNVSNDDLDALTRHLIDHHRTPIDDDGVRHLAKVAWRALAALQRELEK
jgi:hypothetical protein